MAKKPAPNRSTDSVVYVYATNAQKKALEAAAQKLVEKVPGAKLPVYKFVLQAALDEARRMGIKVEG